jgi:hypothetical protein
MGLSRFRARGRRGALAGALLALALVLAQTGAMVHACSHLRASNEHLSSPGGAAQTCADCLSFAPLLAAAGSRSHALPVIAPITTSYRTLVAPLVGLSPRHAFLSRGPPAPV